MIITPSRRGFLIGIGAAVAAPFIVRATSIMPVKALPAEIPRRLHRPWRIVDLTREEAITMFVDGYPIAPAEIDSALRRFRISVPPPGSYQHMVLREYA
jgi:hypothetical protein